MVESVDTRDLKSLAPEGACGFKSRFEYKGTLRSPTTWVHQKVPFLFSLILKSAIRGVVNELEV